MANCQSTECGFLPNGARVLAATDSAGPQVIVQGEGVHLLSRPLRDHRAAVEMGRQVVRRGTEPFEWYDLLNGHDGVALFAVFGDGFRGQEDGVPCLVN